MAKQKRTYMTGVAHPDQRQGSVGIEVVAKRCPRWLRNAAKRLGIEIMVCQDDNVLAIIKP